MEQIPEPSGLQTKVGRALLMEEEEDRHDNLGELMNYEDVFRAAWRMKYGEIHAIVQWCKGQGKGVKANWEIKRIAGKVPLPWFAFISIVVLFTGTLRGWPATWVMSVTGIVALSFFVMAWRLSEWEFNKQGICHICGQPWEGEFKKPIGGRKREAIHSGYCSECGHNKHRFNLWNAAMAQIWRMITNEPIKTRTIFRRISYTFFWWPPFNSIEEFVDPRPVGEGNIYRRGDRYNPKDQSSENLIENTIMLHIMAINNLQKMRRGRY